MKKFNFDEALKQHRAGWVHWLTQNYSQPVTLSEFSKAYRQLRESDRRPYKSARYATATLRRQYKTLQEKFGFFKVRN